EAELRRDAGQPGAHYRRGVILQRWGRTLEAHQSLATAERLGLREPALYEALGQIELARGQPMRAVVWFERAIELAPRRWQAHFALGSALQVSGRVTDAIATFQAVLELAPEQISALGNIGVCRLALDEASAAEALFRRLVSERPSDPRAWIN